jgi:hypothetical protein
MRTFGCFTAVLVLCCLAGALNGPLRAAPDDTRGMAVLAAVVNGDGTLFGAGSGVQSTSRSTTGTYLVRFDRNVGLGDCIASATADFAAASAAVLFDAGAVNVYTRSLTTGSATDSRFHLLVYCAR